MSTGTVAFMEHDGLVLPVDRTIGYTSIYTVTGAKAELTTLLVSSSRELGALVASVCALYPKRATLLRYTL